MDSFLQIKCPAVSSIFFYVYLVYQPFFSALASKYLNEPIFGQLKTNSLVFSTVNVYFPFVFPSVKAFQQLGLLQLRVFSEGCFQQISEWLILINFYQCLSSDIRSSCTCLTRCICRAMLEAHSQESLRNFKIFSYHQLRCSN